MSDITFDFTDGARILIPPGTERFHYKLIDMSNGCLHKEDDAENTGDARIFIRTHCKYFVNWRIELSRDNTIFCVHEFCAKDKAVAFHNAGALGDSVAWLPAIIEFTKKHQCRSTVYMREPYIQMFDKAYPYITFLPDTKKDDVHEPYYASYRLAVWGYGNTRNERMDFRLNNLIKHADMILGVDSHMTPPMLSPTALSDIREPYVCIATRASRYCKEWNYAGGWAEVTRQLKERGYRVLCIDVDTRNYPANAEDFNGNIPLIERIKLLRGCSAFIGLPSGMSWVAWACGVPVVLISGFTDAYVEFDTPYRVAPPEGKCHGCWKTADMRKHKQFGECYYGKANECTTSITPAMVMEKVNKALKD